MQMLLRRRLNSTSLQIGILTALFILAALASAQSFWTESEVWTASVVKYLFDNPGEYNFNIKPLTNLLLYFSFRGAEALDVHPMDTARFFFALNYLALIFLCYRMVRRLSPSPGWTAFVLLLFLSNSFLLKRGSHVRTDLLTTTIILAWLLVSTSDRTKSWTWLRSGAVFLAFSGVAMAITPKSGLFMATLFIVQFTKGRIRLGALMLSGLGLAGLLFWPNWFEGIAALRFFIASTKSGLGAPDYWDPRRFWHVNHFIQQNPILILVWLRNLWVGIFDRKARSQQSLVLIDFANATFAIFLFYPDRLPFFIASLVPFWLLPISELPLDRWAIKIWSELKPSFQTRAAVAAVLLLLGTFAVWERYLFVDHNSNTHHAYVRWIRQFEPKFENLEVLDPAGVIPFQRVHHWFLGPGESHNQDVVERMQARRPDVIIASDKVFLVGSQIRDMVMNDYFWDGVGLLTRRKILYSQAQKQISGHEILQNIKPYILDKHDQPLAEFHLELQTVDGMDLSRFAKWVDKNGERPFDRQVKLTDLVSDLIIPPGAVRWEVQPIKIITPFSLKWAQLFRFDVEN